MRLINKKESEYEWGNKQQKESYTSVRAIDKMKVKDADKSDIGEYTGLRVVCGKQVWKALFIVIGALLIIR